MFYFAYGSNMFSPRLQKRIKTISPLGPGLLSRHQLQFHKKGKDGSAKADAFETDRAQDVVTGVVYQVDQDQISKLDAFESVGKGYERTVKDVFVAGKTISSHVYVAAAAHISPKLDPFCWYLALMYSGALEHELSPDFLETLEATLCKRDQNNTRRSKHLDLIPAELRAKLPRAMV